MLAPLLFGLIVSALGKPSADSASARVAWKAVFYFECVTGVALLLGWAAMEAFQPGVGLGGYRGPALAVGERVSIAETLVRSVPASGFEAMAKNDVLPMILFFGLMGLAARKAGGQRLVEFAASVYEVTIRYAHYVMKLAIPGMIAAIAYTALSGGWESARGLGRFVAAALAAQLTMGVAVFGAIALLSRVPLVRFLRETREALLLALTTTSSAAALPKAMEGMERFGVSRDSLAIVMPLALSFNSAGSHIQLMMGVLFVAQASGLELGWRDMALLWLTLKIAAKGVAGIPRANFVILSATLPVFGLAPDTLPLLLAVDGVIDMVRTPVNVMGHCLASAVVARWEGERF